MFTGAGIGGPNPSPSATLPSGAARRSVSERSASQAKAVATRRMFLALPVASLAPLTCRLQPRLSPTSGRVPARERPLVAHAADVLVADAPASLCLITRHIVGPTIHSQCAPRGLRLRRSLSKCAGHGRQEPLRVHRLFQVDGAHLPGFSPYDVVGECS